MESGSFFFALDPARPGFSVAVVLAGTILNAAGAVGAKGRRTLSGSGAWAAFLLGLVIFLWGGPGAWAILVTFFLTSTLIGRAKRGLVESPDIRQARGPTRDAVQVWANAGASAAGIVWAGVTGSGAALVGAVAGLAAANADTWAGEIGVLSRRGPVSILTGKKVPTGLSGGVTVLGTAASVGGAVCIAAVYAAAAAPGITGTGSPIAGFAVVSIFGTLGAVLDSVLGASIQALYRSGDGTLTENRLSETGEHHTIVSGRRYVTNDTVNLISTTAATVAAAATWSLFPG